MSFNLTIDDIGDIGSIFETIALEEGKMFACKLIALYMYAFAQPFT